MRTSTKVWLILFIVSNVLMLFFFGPMIDSIKYGENGIYFQFATEGYIGLALFAVANISGLFVIGRFIKAQPMGRQIFFSLIPPTVTFMLIILFLFTINTVEQTAIVSAVRDGLNITTPESRYIWVAVVVLVYLIYASIICTILARPVNRVERAVEVLKNGKTRKPIKVGGGKQFQNIEYDLNRINENYKESSKIIKNIEPAIVEEAIEKTSPRNIESAPILLKTAK